MVDLRRRRAVRLVQAGDTVAEAAARVGVHRRTVERYLAWMRRNSN
ncbi:helix-turn-helix domain-containing protein [Paractinoplanes toevensis]